MATPVLIPVQEYLETTYRPDCDYINGEVKERNVGEKKHATIQGLLWAVFHAHRKSWRLRAFTEQRVQTGPHNYRIADVCVLHVGEPDEPIVHSAPLICIEILSRGDTLGDMQERVDDYVAMGVGNIWLFDPIRRRAWTADAQGIHPLHAQEFTIHNTPVCVPLADLYAELDDLAAGR